MTHTSAALKRCPKCEKSKPVAEFYQRSHTGKPHAWCKSCMLAYPRKRNRAGTFVPLSPDERKRRLRAARNRWSSRPENAIVGNIRRMVRAQMTSASTTKGGATFGLLGYTPAELRAHIERTFEPGMTWANYGTAWEVDHILPRVLFDHADPDQIRQCWALTNLRALWKPANRAKGARVEALV
jgi:5-methylcytosine-specific restriction endonuclease McrA